MVIVASHQTRENTRSALPPAHTARGQRSLPSRISLMTPTSTSKSELAATIGELAPPMRLMMTPGPSSVDPRVYRALAAPIVGHLDPWFKTCMDETQTLMRQVFQTENRVTMPLSASGSGGIEAAVLNTL